jgi:hypothetical protein
MEFNLTINSEDSHASKHDPYGRSNFFSDEGSKASDVRDFEEQKAHLRGQKGGFTKEELEALIDERKTRGEERLAAYWDQLPVEGFDSLDNPVPAIGDAMDVDGDGIETADDEIAIKQGEEEEEEEEEEEGGDLLGRSGSLPSFNGSQEEDRLDTST